MRSVDGCAIVPVFMDEVVLVVVDAESPIFPVEMAELGDGLIAIDGDAVVAAFEAVGVPEPLFVLDDLAAVIVGDVHGVGRLLVVIEVEFFAHAGYGFRQSNVKGAAGDVELVNAIVADVAATVVPVPIDSGVEAISIERKWWQGAGPDVVV